MVNKFVQGIEIVKPTGWSKVQKRIQGWIKQLGPQVNPSGGLTLVPSPGFKQQAVEIEHYLKTLKPPQFRQTPVDVVEPEFGKHASGEPWLKLGKKHIGDHDCIVLASGPGTSTMLIQTFLLLRYLRAHRARRIALITGYFPLTRSDKDEGGMEFALPPWVVDLMVASANGKLDRIIAFDLHASQVVMSGTTGLITELHLGSLVIKRAVMDALDECKQICLLFPDESAYKRVEKDVISVEREVAKEFPKVFGTKRRKSSRESRLGMLSGNVDKLSKSMVLMVDDEVGTGGTALNVAKVLLNSEKGYNVAEVRLVVTHPVCGEGFIENFSANNCPISRIYAVDTIPVQPRTELWPLINQEKLVVLPVWKVIAEAIYRHHWGESMRE